MMLTRIGNNNNNIHTSTSSRGRVEAIEHQLECYAAREWSRKIASIEVKEEYL